MTTETEVKQPEAAAEGNTQRELRKIAIPQEIGKIVTDLWARFEEAQRETQARGIAFNQFVLYTKTSLGVPLNETFDIMPDGSAFVEVLQPPFPLVPAAPVPPAADPDPGDVSDHEQK
jgi:hypothetical protein